LFDELAEIVEDYVDTVAERITALGGVAYGTVRMAASASMLPEYPTELLDSMKHVELLADRYAAFGTHAREGIDTASDAGDQATADVYTEITRGIDKALYFLEAHLQA
jgi:starvation-inducible DNA-binding protein